MEMGNVAMFTGSARIGSNLKAPYAISIRIRWVQVKVCA